jgi:hypothetical protein
MTKSKRNSNDKIQNQTKDEIETARRKPKYNTKSILQIFYDPVQKNPMPDINVNH